MTTQAGGDTAVARRNYIRAECIFCKEKNVAGAHYSKRHGLRVSEYVNIQLKNKFACKLCPEKREGNVHAAVRHIAEAHAEILQQLGIEVPALEPIRTRPNRMEALQALGFSSSYARRQWIEQNKEEIARYIAEHGVSAARGHYHISLPTARRIRDEAAISAAAAAAEQESKDMQVEEPVELQDFQLTVSVHELLAETLRVNSEVLEIAQGVKYPFLRTRL